jgi:hypothetical protein
MATWANPSLGGTIKNHLKKWLRNQKPPQGMVKCFIIINYVFSCLSISCNKIWLEVYFGNKKIVNFSKCVFLIEVSKIDSLHFGNS